MKSSALGRILANLAGWLGRSRHRGATARAATMAAPLAMTDRPAAGRTTRATTGGAQPLAPQSNIIVFPLPTGLGWSNTGSEDQASDTPPTTAAMEPTAIQAFPPVALARDLVAHDVPALTDGRPADAAAEASAEITAAAAGLAASEPAAAVRRHRLLARQLRGVARLNARVAATTKRKAGVKKSAVAKAPVRAPRAKSKRPVTAKGATPRTTRAPQRTPLARSATAPRQAVRRPVAQPWILSRSACR